MWNCRGIRSIFGKSNPIVIVVFPSIFYYVLAVMEAGRSNLFREIHKNSWLKRINSDKRLPATKVSRCVPNYLYFIGKCYTLTQFMLQKSEKFWVVFCVHDDFEAILEGYQEPRYASSHQPDWTVSLQTTQHISHSLAVGSEDDFEFVITLTTSVARFTATSW